MIETRPFEVQHYLAKPADRAAYLGAILEEGDPSLIAAGLGEIARDVGVTEFARQAGASREAIYKGPAPGGNQRSTRSPRRRKRLGHG